MEGFNPLFVDWTQEDLDASNVCFIGRSSFDISIKKLQGQIKKLKRTNHPQQWTFIK